jgi:hypothetical protein
MQVADQRGQELIAALRKEISQVRPEFRFRESTGMFGSVDLRESQLGYRANKSVYERHRRIVVEADEGKGQIEIQAHGIGSKFRGLIGMATVFITRSGTAQLASKEPFQINYAEPYESAERRFRPWLEESLVNALTLWRKSL